MTALDTPAPGAGVGRWARSVTRSMEMASLAAHPGSLRAKSYTRRILRQFRLCFASFACTPGGEKSARHGKTGGSWTACQRTFGRTRSASFSLTRDEQFFGVENDSDNDNDLADEPSRERRWTDPARCPSSERQPQRRSRPEPGLRFFRSPRRGPQGGPPAAQRHGTPRQVLAWRGPWPGRALERQSANLGVQGENAREVGDPKLIQWRSLFVLNIFEGKVLLAR